MSTIGKMGVPVVLMVMLLSAVGSASAADQGITGKKFLINGPGEKIVLISKDPSISIAGSDPVGEADSSITFDFGGSPLTFALPKTLWSKNGAGTIFKYENASAPGGPSAIKIAKIKSGLLKVVETGANLAAPNGPETINVTFSLDGGTNTYCMTFSGTGDGSKLLVKDATAGTCCTGQSVGGFCWFLGAAGASCDATCSAIGKTCDAGTIAYAGSEGTDANCQAVLTALGHPGAVHSSAFPEGLGCFFVSSPPDNIRDTSATTCAAQDTFSVVERACACH